MKTSANEIISLSDKLLVAAAKLSDGNMSNAFSAEDLVVRAWQEDGSAFGLRGHEKQYPDSNKVYTKLDGRSGIVTKGWLVKAGQRRLKITEAGLARALSIHGNQDTKLVTKLDRALQDAVSRILSHPEFQAWIKDRNNPSRFRGAGFFWGVAPGMPASVIRARVNSVEQMLNAAMNTLDERGAADVVRQRGHVLFERRDLDLCLEFHRTLKERFRKDLQVLDPEGHY